MSKKPYIIVLGNEKGGTGKSTTAMHIATALLNMGYAVGTIDVDARQGTLTRYMNNREITKKARPEILLPHHVALMKSEAKNLDEAKAEDHEKLEATLANMAACDFIIIDTPGNDTFLSRHAHSFADTLITPLNDSFIDLDVIGLVDGASLDVIRPSIYAEWVFEQKKHRAIRDRGSIDWIVLRNRLANMHSKNKERMDTVLDKLQKRLAFRQVRGFGERVIFKELFQQGLTLHDFDKKNQITSLSHVAARQEMRNLMNAIQLPALQEKIAQATP